MKKQIKLSDAQLKHIADVEAMIEDADREYKKYKERDMTFTALQYADRAMRLRSRIDEIRAGKNFGVGVSTK